MARKSKTLTIAAAGRDQGKVFVITEMSALAAEKWSARAFLALARSGMDIPANIEEMGMAGIALVGARAFAGSEYEDLEPLLDQMLGCVQVKPDPGNPALTRPLIEDDVEEIATLLELRREVMGLHVDFSVVAAWWKARAATLPQPDLSSAPTSGIDSAS